MISKGYEPNWTMVEMEKIKSTVAWGYMRKESNGEQMISTFYEQEH